MQICATPSCDAMTFIFKVSQKPDERDDQINGQLETLLGLLPQLNATCATEAVSGNQTLLNACNSMYDQLYELTEEARIYVSNYN